MIAIETAIKRYLKSNLTPQALNRLRHLRTKARNLYSTVYTKNLVKLAKIHQTDKWGSHWYAKHYQRHFCRLRKNRLKILEIGVGGYENPFEGGDSLRMWKYFFPNSMVYGIDLQEKVFRPEERITVIRGDQTDRVFLNHLVDDIGGLDIVIDDGSHRNCDMIKTFEILFPRLNDEGIYVIEDLQTSYWSAFGGDSEDLDNPSTIVNFLKRLVDCLNHKEILKPDYIPSYYDKNITSIHFYHNLVFVYKGPNNEESHYAKQGYALDSSKPKM